MSADTAGLIVRQVIPRFSITQHIRIHGKATEIPWDGLSKEKFPGDIFTGDLGRINSATERDVTK